MIGAAMTAELHRGEALDSLMDDFKALFPTVLTNAAATPKRRITKVAK